MWPPLLSFFSMSLFRLFCLGLLSSLGLCVSGQGLTDSLRQAALLAARGEVQQLRPIYEGVRERLPAHTALYCRLAFARAEGNTAATIALIDTLEREHERQFDVRGLLALAQERCEALRYAGRWPELADYTADRLAWAKRRSVRSSRQKELKAYQRLATSLLGISPVSIDWQQSQFQLPLLTTDSVPSIAVQVNGKVVQPALITPFGRHTIVAASVLAAQGIDVREGTPFPVPTAMGDETMYALSVDSLRIGACTLRNLVVYAYDDSDVQVDYPILLGLDVLRRLSCFSIGRDMFGAQSHSSHTPQLSDKRLAFSTQGGLMVTDEGTLRPLREEELLNTTFDFERLLLRFQR